MQNVLEQPQTDNGNQLAKQPERVAAQRQLRVVEDTGPLAYLMDTARYEHTQRIAAGMARASLIPDHLRSRNGNSEETMANCFLVVNQSLRWGFDPFAVAPETYAIGGKLAYQGKLIAAVVNARSNIKNGLQYLFNTKSGDDFAIVVYGSPNDIPAEAMPLLTALAERNDRQAVPELQKLGVLAVRLSVGQAKTQNQMWSKDPEQKLVYSGAIRWARRHRPEIVLGVLTEDDAERIAASPTGTSSRSVAQAFNESAPSALPAPAFPDSQLPEAELRAKQEVEANALIEAKAAQARQSTSPSQPGAAGSDAVPLAGDGEHPETIEVKGQRFPVMLPATCRADFTKLDDAIRCGKPANMNMPPARNCVKRLLGATSWEKAPTEVQDEIYRSILAGEAFEEAAK